MKNLLFSAEILVVISCFTSCHGGTNSAADVVAADSLVIAMGDTVFHQHCSGCHNFRQDGIGPQTNIESVNLVQPGHDYGWPVREGNFLLDPHGNLDKIYPLPANDSVMKYSYPVAEFDHDEGNAISGGLEYQGNAIPQLQGKYLFGDIPSGRLFFINTAEIKQGRQAPLKEWKIAVEKGRPETFRELIPDGRVDLHFGRDSRGEIYILTKWDGNLYKLLRAE